MRRDLLALAGGVALAAMLAGALAAGPTARRANLVIRIADTPDPARPSPGVRYRVSLTNAGPGRAEDVVVRLRASASTQIVGIGVPSGCFADSKGVGCRRSGLLARRTWRLNFGVEPCTAGTLVATATASSTTPDPRPVDNVARARTTILPGPPPPPPPGGSGGCR